jgi:putative MATE family efflux protein
VKRRTGRFEFEASLSKERSARIGREKIPGLLFRLSLPAVVTSLSTVAYSLVDAMFIGRLGTSALGAISVAFPLFSVIGGIGLTFGIGAGSFIARSLGRGEKSRADRAASTALVSVLLLGAVIGVLGNLFLESLLLILGATETILPFAIDYARILIFGSFVTVVNMTLGSCIRAEGSATFSMLGMLTGASLNVVFDPLFIFLLGMGIKGAAVATVLAQGVTLVLFAGYFVLRKGYVRITLSDISISAQTYAEILKIGTPAFAANLLISLVIAVLNSAANQFGDSVVAAVGITIRLMSFGIFLVFGYSRGFRSIAAYNYGAGKYRRVVQAVKYAAASVSIFTFLYAMLMLLLAESILALFTTDPEVILIGSRILRAANALFPLFGYEVILVVLYQALGRAFSAGILALARQGLILVAMALVLPRLFGLTGIVMSVPVADAWIALLFLFFTIKAVNELKQLAKGKSDE